MCKRFELAPIFTDNMVFQRDAVIPVWGEAEEGLRIVLEFCGQKKYAESVGGKWKTELDPAGAGGPFEMKISCGEDEVVLKDILAGEVWIAGGQSNMEFRLLDTLDANAVITQADFPSIRYYDVPRIPYVNAQLDNPELYDIKNEWKICTPENAKSFSAVAYHFAKNIHASLGIPVGIIGCSWGGTSASCWMSEEYLSSDDDIKVYLEEYEALISTQSPEVYEKERVEYDKKVEQYNEKLEKARRENIPGDKALEAAGPFPWPPPIGPKCPLSPVGLYHTMVREITPFAVRGVIFYQGESDAVKPTLYSRLFGRMIQNWRDDWNNPELPFLFVQLTSFGWDNNPDGEEWAIIREQQLKVSKEINNTAMAVSVDCGDRINIHPTDKKPVGERLALLAGAEIYHENTVCRGPVYRGMEIEKNEIILSFDYIADGLSVKGETLCGFKICGEDRKFVDAKAEIRGNQIAVSADEVLNPAAVRYGWANYPDVNLYNSAGLPASPFRTDDF